MSNSHNLDGAQITVNPPQDSAAWRHISSFPLLILQGLTGVGKTTTVNAIRTAGVHFRLLPNRRALTDQIIIPQMQTAAGKQLTQVKDRAERFSFTARYRQQHAGGMAHVLANLWVHAPEFREKHASEWLFFDGLRGANEISFAVKTLPNARFLNLTAPHRIRLQRLLGRHDAFDWIATGSQNDRHTSEIPAVPFLSDGDRRTLDSMIHAGACTMADLQAKLKIIKTEYENYETDQFFESPPQNTIEFSTHHHSPQHIAQRVAGQLDDWLFAQTPR